MPRFYFDVRDSRGYHRDQFGDEYNDFEEARAQAQALLPDLVREDLPDGDFHSVSCDVRDERDLTVYRGELTYQGTRDPV